MFYPLPAASCCLAVAGAPFLRKNIVSACLPFLQACRCACVCFSPEEAKCMLSLLWRHNKRDSRAFVIKRRARSTSFLLRSIWYSLSIRSRSSRAVKRHRRASAPKKITATSHNKNLRVKGGSELCQVMPVPTTGELWGRKAVYCARLQWSYCLFNYNPSFSGRKSIKKSSESGERTLASGWTCRGSELC